MRYVKFIKRLVIDQIPMLSRDEIRYQSMENMVPIGPDNVLLPDSVVETQIVPIHRLCKAHRDRKTGENYVDTTYIAYSKEVQELLEMPFDVIKSELEESRRQLNLVRRRLGDMLNANVWTRIKYLFKQELFL